MKYKLIIVNLVGILLITGLVLAQIFSRMLPITVSEIISLIFLILGVILSTANLNFVLLEKKLADKGVYNAISNVAISVYLFIVVILAINSVKWFNSNALLLTIEAFFLLALIGVIVFRYKKGMKK